MAPPKITLYVDAVSPFGYVVYHVFRVSLPQLQVQDDDETTIHMSCPRKSETNYAAKNEPIFKNVDITYVPVFLGGIMKACNNTPPIQIKSKSTKSCILDRFAG